MPGAHLTSRRNLGPATVHNGKIFVIDPHPTQSDTPEESLELLSFDLEQLQLQLQLGDRGVGDSSGSGVRAVWKRRVCGGGGPKLISPVAGWAQDGRLFVFSEALRKGNVEIALWSVGLDQTAAGSGGAMATLTGPAAAATEAAAAAKMTTPGWEKLLLAGPAVATTPDRERLTGQLTTSWGEGSACFDPVSRKAYAFGGWSEDLYAHTVNPETGKLTQLLGRYFNTIVEFDIDRRIVRGVELATRNGIPERRAECMVN